MPTNPSPASAFRRVPATVVGVDVTAHKEERHITDAKKSGKKSNTRVRYYVELVVGSPRESHTRLGFSGTFKALLRLHKAFESIFNAKHRMLMMGAAAAAGRESLHSVTSASSASSASSPSRRRTVSIPPSSANEELPKILPFPASNPLLVKLQPRHAESDDKSRVRCDALFAYYTALLNSEERELYLDYIQSKSEATANNTGDNQEDTIEVADSSAHAVDIGAVGRRTSGFFKKLFSRRDPTQVEAIGELPAAKSQRQRASALDAKLEFVPPVHVSKKSSTTRSSRR